MINPSLRRLSALSFFLLYFFSSTQSFSKENFADLHQDNFYNSDKTRQFFTIGGGYSSDYNSKEYEIQSGYNYRSKKYIHELDFLHQVENASTTTKAERKVEELYDFEASSRMMIGHSANYMNLYNRMQYDQFSDYYYDVASAAGLGRFFFNGNLESSINLGYDNVKNFDSSPILIGVLASHFKITNNIQFSTRGLLQKAELTYDEEIKNVLSFKLQENLFFELTHTYAKDRYVDSSKTRGDYRVNRVSRDAYARFKYNF